MCPSQNTDNHGCQSPREKRKCLQEFACRMSWFAVNDLARKKQGQVLIYLSASSRVNRYRPRIENKALSFSTRDTAYITIKIFNVTFIGHDGIDMSDGNGARVIRSAIQRHSLNASMVNPTRPAPGDKNKPVLKELMITIIFYRIFQVVVFRIWFAVSSPLSEVFTTREVL